PRRGTMGAVDCGHGTQQAAFTKACPAHEESCQISSQRCVLSANNLANEKKKQGWLGRSIFPGTEAHPVSSVPHSPQFFSGSTLQYPPHRFLHTDLPPQSRLL